MHGVSLHITGTLIKNRISLLDSFVKFHFIIESEKTNDFSFPPSEVAGRVCVGKNFMPPYLSEENPGDNARFEIALDILSMFTKKDWYDVVIDIAKIMWDKNKETIEFYYDL